MRAPFIYVVDDHEDFLGAMIALLRWRRFTADGTTDPVVAADAIPVLRPDLILVDQCMPDLSGVELILRVRSFGYRGKAIVFSGLERPDWLPPGVAFLEKAQYGSGPIVSAITAELGLNPRHYEPERPRHQRDKLRVAERASAV